jgi:hypothetical protein
VGFFLTFVKYTMRAHEFISEVGLSTGRSFKGSPCKTDCSGHRAGYQWAKEKGLKALGPAKPGTSKSFLNGANIASTDQDNKEPDETNK